MGPLLDASLSLRLKAVLHILDLITRELHGALDTVERAKQMAKSFK